MPSPLTPSIDQFVDQQAMQRGVKPPKEYDPSSWAGEPVAQGGFVENVKEIGQSLKQNAPGLVGMGVASMIPGGKFLGPLKRTIAGTGADYLTRRAQGTPGGEAAMQSLTQFAPSQLLGEGLMGLGVHGRSQRAGAKQFGAQEAQQAAYEKAKEAFPAQKAAQEAATAQKELGLNAAQQKAQAGAATAARQQASKGMVEAIQADVPAWKGIPATEEGLYKITRGPERLKINQAFDTAFEKSLPKPGQTQVQIPSMDAATLKLKGIPGKQGKGPKPLESTQYTTVDAVDAARAILGKKGGIRNRVIRALDEANVGDPAARKMYRDAQALLAFSDKAKIFKGSELSLENVQKGLGDWKAGGEMVTRQGGGPLYQAAQKAQPVPPAAQLEVKQSPLTPPKKPAAPVQKIEGHRGPGALAGYGVGALGGLAAGHQLGIPHPFVAGHVGGSLGSAAGAALAGPKYTGQTVPPLPKAAQAVPGILGELTRLSVPALWQKITDWSGEKE